MTTLAQYDRARMALAEATRIDQVLPILDEVEHVKLHAKQIADRELLAEASAFQMKAERHLGFVIAAAKQAGHFRQGKRSVGKSADAELSRATLEEVGVDKKLSSRSQKAASISEQAFERMVEARRHEIAAGKAIPANVSEVNGARSIMGSRQEVADSLDYFPTPPWATRALIERILKPHLGGEPLRSAWEPACGEGHMAEPLREYFETVFATDIYDYDYGDGQRDFLVSYPGEIDGEQSDWIITNPPFGDKTEDFVLRALRLARVGVAMFVRLQWLESIGRYEAIFRDHAPTIVAFFAERVNLCKGRWEPEGTTATAYIWLVWIRGSLPRPPAWIPPGQRESLSRPDDAVRFTTQPRTPLPRSDEPFDPETGELGATETPQAAEALTEPVP